MQMKQIRVIALISTFALFSYVGCSASKPMNSNNNQPTEQKLVRSDFDKNEITAQCNEAIETLETQLAAIGDLAPERRNINNTLLGFESALANFSDTVQNLTFMGYVSTSKEMRDEGSACEEKIGQTYVSIFTQRKLYDAVKSALPRSLDERRLLSEMLKAFERNGLKLSDADLNVVKDLKIKLSAKESKFSANLVNDTTFVEFTADELEGVPADAMSRFPQLPNGKYKVTTKSTDYLAIAENATKSETRRRMLEAYQKRGEQVTAVEPGVQDENAGKTNTQLLTEAIALRHQIATKLGYATWADYRLDGRMAESKDNVNAFLADLRGKLAQRTQDDMAKLLNYKKELDPAATKLDQWDINYLNYQLKKRDYSLDNEEIRNYFPADVVVAGMFKVYSQILGVKYKEIDGPKWHDSVKLYEIRDASDDSLLAYFYADFFPRDGKYGHAAAFTLIAGRMVDGRYNLPVSSIVANFTPPANGKPSLVTHDEVETIFHEFGHIMHQTLTRAPYASLSGSSTAQDFVEAPSQMLENWVWSPEVLAEISGRYDDHSQKLPQALLTKMLEAKDFSQGYYYSRQLLFGLFDMSIHTQENVNVDQVFDGLYKDVIGVDPIAGTHFPATFGHMMGGYDAGYYSYLWSEVYAQDMFSIFENTSLMSAETGARYRSTILNQGNMRDAMDLLKEFLGRDPNKDAFYKKLNIH